MMLYIQVCHPESLLLFHHHYHHHYWQSSPFLALDFLRNSVRLHPVFTSSYFATLILLQDKVLDFLSTPRLEEQIPVFRPSGTEWPNYILMHQVLFLSSSTTHKAAVDVF
jgi:hypothetical protein